MTKKILKILICVVMSLCVLCGGTSVFAESSTANADFNIQPIVPEVTEEETVEEAPTTEKETKPQTTKEETTRKQPTQAPTKRPDNYSSGNNRPNGNNNSAANNTQATTAPEETTEEPLPEGAFYVYLELNDGSKQQKTVMKKAGLLPEPTEPTRKGFIFDGWYSDAKFENSWNFFVDKATKEMTVYAKWVADPSTTVFKITIKDAVGGTIKVTPETASEGEAVTITVTPDDGKRLAAGSLMIDGKPSDVLSFIMPAGDVTISASFEDIPASEKNSDEKSNLLLPLLLAAAVIVVIGVVAFVVYTKKKNTFDPDYDPDNPVVEDIDEEAWVDDTIVVEDGFKEGKIVKDNIEPDFGTPEDSMFGDIGADDIDPEE